MRELIRDFVRVVAETLPVSEPVYEFGSLQLEGQEGFADLRPFFPGKKYVGCDMREGLGVDRILDLHHLDLPPESVGTALMFETLEHVEFVREAVKEVHRVLKPGGMFVVSTQMNFHIHRHPHDYWRFTPEGLESILKIFPTSFVGCVGDSDFPHTLVAVAFKGKPRDGSMEKFTESFGAWKRRWSPTQPLWKKTLLPLIPPVMLTLHWKATAAFQNLFAGKKS